MTIHRQRPAFDVADLTSRKPRPIRWAYARTWVFALALSTPWIASPLAAETDWPTRPIKFITPFAAGGPTDTLARPVADHLTKVFGQPVIIENRPGGGMTIAATIVARAQPDGYTLLFGTNSVFSLAPLINANAQYTSDSLQPIIKVATSPMVLEPASRAVSRRQLNWLRLRARTQAAILSPPSVP